MSDLKQRLEHGPWPLIADGAMGSLLLDAFPSTAPEWRGNYPCCEVLNRTSPESIREIHRAYVASGAEILTTNTFCCSPMMLERFGLARDAADLNYRAAQLACEVRDSERHSRRLWVAGSVGPIVLNDTAPGIPAAHDAYEAQLRALISGGVDLVLVETALSTQQVRSALHSLRHIPGGADLPVWVSVSPGRDSAFPDDVRLDDLLDTCREFAVSALGVNCGSGPASLAGTLSALSQKYDGPLYCAPSAGLPEKSTGGAEYPIGDSGFLAKVSVLLETFRILVVGGCCGTTPEYIARLRTLLGEDVRSHKK